MVQAAANPDDSRAPHAQVPARLSALMALGILVPWLAYTHLYFWLHPRGLTLDPSLFMYLTGKPDPTCGLTRTFAWMWRGDVGQAVSVYPLGPALFLASLGLTGYFGFVLLTGRELRTQISPRQRRTLVAIALVAIGANWISKLIWLGM